MINTGIPVEVKDGKNELTYDVLIYFNDGQKPEHFTDVPQENLRYGNLYYKVIKGNQVHIYPWGSIKKVVKVENG